MHLSRIQLNKRRRDAWRLLSSPQRLHAAVLAGFPDPPTGPQRDAPRVLWRLDQDDEKVFLYVVSPQAPDLTHIAEQAGWPSIDRGASKPYGPFLDRLEQGQTWAFRLTANPTRYVRPPDGGPAKRLAHVTVAQQEAWLVAKAASAGFSLVGSPEGAPSLLVTGREVQSFRRGQATSPVTVGTAQFDGVLQVDDAAALRASLVTGIGPAKAYGCGLLTLAPVR